ncbi:hypothetical protein H6G00_19705 [Leptolyngbya sp. FACHB-541]|uniref:PIN domain-containing protein n=1 Tax=Leptolyngbya sp. FACHB-541 TaxID=2692810 RepID=UPI001681FE59|nr:PIN domain-containing protein [Leptolyngbya sp. FACHB-541]MBD1998819.1 hypothetical protein [Leptolyngbya sp. FACHB-541]
MAAIPPVMLVLDISTLSSATPREWIEFSRVGTCCIPQVIYEEMRLLFDRSPDPDLERISREFNRFYPHSGWKITDVVGHHAALKTNTSHALTKRARVSLAVAKCAYGLAQEFPQNLIVLVASDRELQQKVYDMQVDNLCAIPGSGLIQWSRSGQRPIAVIQKIQQLRAKVGTKTAVGSTKPVTSSKTATTGIKKTSIPAASPTHNTSITPKRALMRPSLGISGLVSQLIAIGFTLGALAVVAWIVWTLFLGKEFNPQQIIPFSNSSEQTTGTFS